MIILYQEVSYACGCLYSVMIVHVLHMIVVWGTRLDKIMMCALFRIAVFLFHAFLCCMIWMYFKLRYCWVEVLGMNQFHLCQLAKKKTSKNHSFFKVFCMYNDLCIFTPCAYLYLFIFDSNHLYNYQMLFNLTFKCALSFEASDLLCVKC